VPKTIISKALTRFGLQSYCLTSEKPNKTKYISHFSHVDDIDIIDAIVAIDAIVVIDAIDFIVAIDASRGNV
jgi:hypothetical protein